MTEYFSAERRLVLRLLDYWQHVRELRRWPRFDDIDPEALDRDWPNCALLRWSESTGCFRFTAIGATLDPNASLLGKAASECLPNTLIHYAVESVDRVLIKHIPVSFGGERPKGDETILYRSIVLPLGDQEEAIDGLLIGVNYRLVRSTEEVAEFPASPVPERPVT